MAGHDPRVSVIVNRGRALGRSLLLLAHYISVFVAFVGRSVRWMVLALRWLCLCAQYTTSMFDSIYSLLTWGRRRGPPGTRQMCAAPDRQPEGILK